MRARLRDFDRVTFGALLLAMKWRQTSPNTFEHDDVDEPVVVPPNTANRAVVQILAVSRREALARRRGGRFVRSNNFQGLEGCLPCQAARR